MWVLGQADMMYRDLWGKSRLTEIPNTIGAVAAICFVSIPANSQRFFSAKLLVWLGDISFCMYILHDSVYFSLGAYVFMHLIEERQFSYGLAAFCVWLICMPVILLFSWIAARLFDKGAIYITQKAYKAFFA